MGGKQASTKSEGRFEFRFNTAEGRVYDCYVETEADLTKWLDAMPHWTSSLVMGWLHKRKLCVAAHCPTAARPLPPRPLQARVRTFGGRATPTLAAPCTQRRQVQDLGQAVRHL